MSGTSLEILNVRRELERQNNILQAILEEMKTRNKKTDELIELQKEQAFDLKEIAKQYY